MNEVALHRFVHAAERRREHVVERRLQLGNAAAADGDGLDDRHAELALERLRVELEPVALGEIDHVEHDDRRQAELDQLQAKRR